MKRIHIGTFDIAVKPPGKSKKPARMEVHGIVGEFWAVQTGVALAASAPRVFTLTDKRTGLASPPVTGTAIDAAGLVAELDAIGPHSVVTHEQIAAALGRFAAESKA